MQFETTSDADQIVNQLHRLIAEEMHLLAQQLEDSLDGAQSDRLDELTETLDSASELLECHRARRPRSDADAC